MGYDLYLTIIGQLELVEQFAEKIGFKGIIDADIFKVDDEYFISEVNPCLGGGHLYGYECGVNIPKMIIENINRNANENAVDRYDEGIHMMKYNEMRIKK